LSPTSVYLGLYHLLRIKMKLKNDVQVQASMTDIISDGCV